MAEEKVKLTFEADVSAFKKSVQQIPNITEKQVDKMVANYRAGLKKIDKATGDGAKGAKKLADALGFGDKAGKIQNLAESIGLIGPAGLAGAAGIIGGAGLVAGMVALTKSAGEALTKIEALGLEEIISPTAARNVHAANDAMDSISIATGALTVALASGLAPAITYVSTKMIEVELFTGKVIDAFGSGALSVDSWGAVMASFVLGPMKLLAEGLITVHRLLGTNTDAMESGVASFGAYADSVAASAFSVHADTQAQRESIAIQTSAEPVIAAVTAARVKSTKATTEATAAIQPLIEGTKVLSGTTEQLAKVVSAASDVTVDSGEKQKATADELTSAWSEMGSVVSEFSGVVGELADQEQAAHEAEIARLDESIAKKRERLAEALAAGNTELAAKIKNSIQGDKAIAAAEKKAAKRAFIASKSIAVMQIAINTAQATIALLASPAIAPLGPAAPGVAAGIAIGTGAISAAAVAAAPAPKFHAGRAPDEQPATLTSQEAVLNPRAVSRLGGPQGVNALNSGGGMGGSPAVYLAIGSRQAEQIVQDGMGSGVVSMKMRKPDPLGSGRYGGH